MFLGGFFGVLVSLLGKEDGLVIAAAVPVVAFALPVADETRAALRFKRAAAAFLGALLAVGIVAWLRHEALGSALPAAPAAPLLRVPLVDRLALGVSAWWQGLYDALMPWTAPPPSRTIEDLMYREVSTTPGAALGYGAGVVGFGLAGVGAVLLFLGWLVQGQAGARLSLALSAFAALPLIQLVPAGEIFAPRFLYQPLLLGTVWVAAVGRRLGVPLQVALLLALAAVSVFRAAPVYDSRESYWQAHLPAHATDAKIWNALGECAREKGQLDEARKRFERSHELDPEYSRSVANLGAMAMKAGDLDEAERWLTEAIFEGRSEDAPRGNLATVLMRQGRIDEALEFYQDAARLSPGRVTYHRGIARASLELGLYAEARAALETAAKLAPNDPATASLLLRLNDAEGEDLSLIHI